MSKYVEVTALFFGFFFPFVFLSLVFPNISFAYYKQILSDPDFAYGVAVGFGNTYPNDLDQVCIDRWKQRLPDYSLARWTFTEISERFYFCNEDATNRGSPFVTNDYIRYISPNYGMKKFFIDRDEKVVRMIYDTSWEWRGGCNLCMKWNLDGQILAPLYGNSFTNWPHFIVGQIFSPSYVPSQWDLGDRTIKPFERIYLDKEHKKIIFSGSFKLNKVAKKDRSRQCPAGDWKIPTDCNLWACQGTECSQNIVPDHAIFYVAFVLWRVAWNENIDGPKVIYQLLPLVDTQDGDFNYGGDGFNGRAYFMGDQFGEKTYFAKFGEGSTVDVKKLRKGEWISINLDVINFSKETLRKYNEIYSTSLSASNYYLAGILVGWEIWGGYDTDIEFKNLTLVAEILPDLNNNNKVDIFDYNILVTNFGKTGNAGWIPADINKDGKVDIFDYNILVSEFGKKA